MMQPSKEIDNKRNPLNTALISVFWASVAIFIQRSHNQKQRCSLCQIREVVNQLFLVFTTCLCG